MSIKQPLGTCFACFEVEDLTQHLVGLETAVSKLVEHIQKSLTAAVDDDDHASNDIPNGNDQDR